MVETASWRMRMWGAGLPPDDVFYFFVFNFLRQSAPSWGNNISRHFWRSLLRVAPELRAPLNRFRVRASVVAAVPTRLWPDAPAMLLLSPAVADIIMATSEAIAASFLNIDLVLSMNTAIVGRGGPAFGSLFLRRDSDRR